MHNSVSGIIKGVKGGSKLAHSKGFAPGKGCPVLSASWPAILLASLILLPYLGKAHTIDDPTFLLQAEHVLKDPLHPTAFDMVFDGEAIRLSSQMVSGPVMAYLLVPSVLLGGAEWVAHLVQYMLMILAIIATVSLAFRLGLDPIGARTAALLLASTPAVMALATTSMPDVPAMAFAVLGMERFFAWKQEGIWHQGLAASIGFALASLSRPHLILILPIAAISLLCEQGRRNEEFPKEILGSLAQTRKLTMKVLPLVLASLAILAIAKITADPSHTNADFLSTTISRFRQASAATNAAAFFLHWITLFPLGLVWIWMGVRWKKLWFNPALYLTFAVAFGVAILHKNIRSIPAIVLAVSFAGLFMLLDILFDCWQRRDGVQLFLWAWLLIALPAIAYVQLPSKYLVGSAPAAALLLARLYCMTGARRRSITWAAVSAGAVLCLLIITADARFAAVGKRVAAEQIAPMVAGGNRVWSNGGWGFAWYALKAGATPLSGKPPHPSNGDILVSSSASPHIPLERFPNRSLIATMREVSRFGQIMNYSAGAGFYSNGYGFFPWTWRNGEIEYATIWKMHHEVEQAAH